MEKEPEELERAQRAQKLFSRQEAQFPLTPQGPRPPEQNPGLPLVVAQKPTHWNAPALLNATNSFSNFNEILSIFRILNIQTNERALEPCVISSS